LKLEGTPKVVSDTVQYIEAQFSFSADWVGTTKVAHFKLGNTIYDITLNSNNQIVNTDNLNLSAGTWEVYVHGSNETKRITTSTIYLLVDQSGILNGEPLPDIPLSMAEQILQIAQSVRDDADSGEFDGESAGFGTPEATITLLPSGSDPTIEIETSGSDTAKIFKFIFQMPAANIDWEEV